MLVNNNTNSPQFGMALKLGALCENGKSTVGKCFSKCYHYLDLQKISASQSNNLYDILVLPVKKGSKKVMAQVVKPALNKDESPVVLATVYPRRSMLCRADENMNVLTRACEKANSFNRVV